MRSLRPPRPKRRSLRKQWSDGSLADINDWIAEGFVFEPGLGGMSDDAEFRGPSGFYAH